MATVSTDINGNRRIQFSGLDRKRRTLYMGKLSARAADDLKRLVEDILESAACGLEMSPTMAKRLDDLSDEVFAKLVHAGLVNPRVKRRPKRLAEFLDGYISSRGDVKPRTRINLDQARKKLVAYFGGKTRLDEITLAEAVRYARWLESPEGGALSPNTARRLLGRAKQMFAVAVDDELLARNVFKQKGLRCTVTGNRDRMHFVTEEVAQKVLEACPTLEWKLIFSLARWGGLRTPSETLALRWGDVRWDIGRIRVPVPKLEHHEGHGERWLPMFPELRVLLEQAYDAAEPGTEFVISRTRNSGVNFRTQLLRIIAAAGVSPWEKLFQNLRSTRATELSERYPAHVVAAWLGHSVEVGAKHYMQVTDDHFTNAASGNVKCNAIGAETGEIWAESGTPKNEKTRISAGFSRQPVPPLGAMSFADGRERTSACGKVWPCSK
jgi:integrase